MLGTIRKHQTWLWAIIITVTVASFIFFGPTNSSIGNFFSGRGQNQLGTIDGQPISTVAYNDALRDATIDALIRRDQQPDLNSPAVNRDAYFKMFIAKKAKDAGIKITNKAIVERIHQVFGEAPADVIEKEFLQKHGLELSDLQRYYRTQLALEQLAMTVGLSGKLVTPQEAETMYRLENQDLDCSMVYFSASNYTAAVPIMTEAVRRFYTNQLATYRVPEEVQVDYVRFDYTNYQKAALATLTNLDELVNASMTQLGTNLFHDTKTPAESKAAVRNEIIRRRSAGAAHVAADEYAHALDEKKPHSLQNMALLATNGMTVHTTAPFERTYGPQEFIAPEDFAHRAFALDTNDDLFAGPILGDQAAYVIGLNRRIPSELPAFEKIEAKVTSDYRLSFALQLARQAALDFNAYLTNSTNMMKSFNAVCAETHLRPVQLEPFSVSSRTLPGDLDEKVDVGIFKQIAFNTPVGKTSPPVGSRDGALILHVEKLLPFNDTKMKAELPAFLAYLRSARQNEAFNQWINQQMRQDTGFAEKVQSIMQGSPSRTVTKTATARPRS